MRRCLHTAALANLDVARKKPVETMEINVVGTWLNVSKPQYETE